MINAPSTSYEQFIRLLIVSFFGGMVVGALFYNLFTDWNKKRLRKLNRR